MIRSLFPDVYEYFYQEENVSRCFMSGADWSCDINHCALNSYIVPFITNTLGRKISKHPNSRFGKRFLISRYKLTGFCKCHSFETGRGVFFKSLTFRRLLFRCGAHDFSGFTRFTHCPAKKLDMIRTFCVALGSGSALSRHMTSLKCSVLYYCVMANGFNF